ncbi:MAG: GIY-YIG nuclease family protein [Rhizobiales bacterium]|nr:GIY-YIG nuclease family protein [Hyphomicrobiales bacterium]
MYILSNKPHGTLYVGVTSNLPRRIWEHREGLVAGFTQRYAVKRLVFFEYFSSISDAIQREKRIKEWRRSWKINLIVSMNPDWRDLYEDLND